MVCSDLCGICTGFETLQVRQKRCVHNSPPLAPGSIVVRLCRLWKLPPAQVCRAEASLRPVPVQFLQGLDLLVHPGSPILILKAIPVPVLVEHGILCLEARQPAQRLHVVRQRIGPALLRGRTPAGGGSIAATAWPAARGGVFVTVSTSLVDAEHRQQALDVTGMCPKVFLSHIKKLLPYF